MDLVFSFLSGIHRKLVQYGQHPPTRTKVSQPASLQQSCSGRRFPQPTVSVVSFNPHLTEEAGSSATVCLELAERRARTSPSSRDSISQESSVVLPSEESVTTAPLSCVETDDFCRSSPFRCRLPLVFNSARNLRVLTATPSVQIRQETQSRDAEGSSFDSRRASSRSSSGGRVSRQLSVRSSGRASGADSINPNGASRKHSVNLQQLRQIVHLLTARTRSPFTTPEPHMSPRSKRKRSLTRLSGEEDSQQEQEASSSEVASTGGEVIQATQCTSAFINKAS